MIFYNIVVKDKRKEEIIINNLTIGEVELYLKKGYDFTIAANYHTFECCGLLLLKGKDCSFKDVKEVEVDKFLDSFLSIKERVRKAEFCTLKYDKGKEKIVNSIERRVVGGFPRHQVVNGFVVEEDDLLSSFLSLDRMIMNYKYAKEKEKCKLKVKER